MSLFSISTHLANYFELFGKDRGAIAGLASLGLGFTAGLVYITWRKSRKQKRLFEDPHTYMRANYRLEIMGDEESAKKIVNEYFPYKHLY